MIKIAPSILSANFANLEAALKAVEGPGGADLLHLDIMDGHYVPALTIGPCVVEALRAVSGMYFETHLMVSNPDALLPAFAQAGSNRIVVHPETCPHLHRTLASIKDLGLSAGLALNPSTALDLCALPYVGDMVDSITIMSVNPGFAAQKFIGSSLGKIADLKSLLTELELDRIVIEVDGGVNEFTAQSIVRAGASVLVAGNAIYKSPLGPLEATRKLRELAK